MPAQPISSEKKPAILVVGAGPSGLVLALCLARYGVPIRVIEKESSHRVGRRGAGITPRSLELFHFLGILPDDLKLAHNPVPMRSYELPGGTNPLKTWRMSPIDEPTPACPFLNALFLGQDQVEHILRERLKQEFHCEVELGSELQSFIQHEDHVEATILKDVHGVKKAETIEVKYLVGTDGARGIVRKHLGLYFLGETRDEECLVVGGIKLMGLDTEHIHMWTKGPAATISAWPGQTKEGDLFSVQIAGSEMDRARLVSDPQALAKFFHSVTGRIDVEFRQVVWISEYTPSIRMVDKLRDRRVFVAGDAAHVHSLIGGQQLIQSMNSSIQDPFNLGWKLGLVHKGLAHDNLLDTYNEERLPVIAEMLNKTTELHIKTFKSSELDDESHWHRGKSLDQLGVNYRWSSIVVGNRTICGKDSAGDTVVAYENVGNELRAGDRAPDAPGLRPTQSNGFGEPLRFFDMLTYSQHTVLIFGHSVQDALPVLDLISRSEQQGRCRTVNILPEEDSTPPSQPTCDFVVQDVEQHAYTIYGLEKDSSTIVVVRPDGYIGVITRDVGLLQSYFEDIFGVSQ